MGKSHKKILAIRFSAMGDVAMTIPVIRQVLDKQQDLRIVLVSNRNWGALCEGIDRLEFFPSDLKGAHKGFLGLFRLFKALRAAHPDISAVADLHHVLRSRIVRMFYFLLGIPVVVIDKGREGKKLLTRKDGKVLKPLLTTIYRYQQVFFRLGLKIGDAGIRLKTAGEGRMRIGIAPFATYKEKTYPLKKMEQVMAALNEEADLLLFGGGATEVALLHALAAKYPRMQVVAGKYKLEEELKIINGLDLMISMDSANMHLASLAGVPVVSVWGATHPYAGFMGFGQPEANAVQISLYCRPCSVFGNKPCYRGDHACMEQLAPSLVVDRVREVLMKK